MHYYLRLRSSSFALQPLQIKQIHRAVVCLIRFLYPPEAQLLIQLHGRGEPRMCFKVQFFIPRRTRPLLRDAHQLFSAALALRGIVQIQLLKLRAVLDAVKLRDARATYHASVIIERDEVTALRRLCVIKRAQVLKLRIKIRRPVDIKMEVL